MTVSAETRRPIPISAETLRSISTPDKVESRLGTLEFNDGAPSNATAELLYDNLDFIHGVQAFLTAYPAASMNSLRRGFLEVGAEDNSTMMFSELMDSSSVFLTANCDTVYFCGFIDLSDGPIVMDVPKLESPSAILGTIDDMWFHWVTDFGLPGPDRGQGGRYLFVPPGYDGLLPDSGFHVFHTETLRMLVVGRAFMVDNDPSIPADAIRAGFRLSPYAPGGQGTAIATFLAGDAPLGAVPEVQAQPFIEASGKAFNTVAPNDFGFWEVINEVIQSEPPSSGDPELRGMLARLGIVHGKEFKPDDRMHKLLEEAAAVGNATARTVAFAFRPEEGFAYYDDSNWYCSLWVGGYEFMDPPPQITKDGVVHSPSDGARKLNSKLGFLYPATGVTPAMCMRLEGVGSQYLMAVRGGDGEYLDGGRNYRLTLPPDIPESRFWSVMVYDRQTRSMLQTEQPHPDLGSQSGTVEVNSDGSRDLYFGPTAPEGKENNWLQTVPGKGWFTIFRLYSPGAAFFDKTWRPSEIELVD